LTFRGPLLDNAIEPENRLRLDRSLKIHVRSPNKRSWQMTIALSGSLQ